MNEYNLRKTSYATEHVRYAEVRIIGSNRRRIGIFKPF